MSYIYEMYKVIHIICYTYMHYAYDTYRICIITNIQYALYV